MRLIMVLTAVMMAAAPSKAHSAAPECAERLRACNELILRADAAIASQANTLQTLDDANSRLMNTTIEQAARLEQASTWYNQPQTTGALGFTFGVILGAILIGR